ncbi:MAG: type II CAAX endopeptidase family protein [bacterium]
MASQQLLFESTSPQAALLVGTFYFLLILTGTVAAGCLLLRLLKSPLDWNLRIQWIRDRPWTWRENLGVFAAMGFLICLAVTVSALFKKPYESILLVLQSLLMDITGLAVIAGVIALRRWNWRTAFGLTSNPLTFLKLGLVCYVVLMPFMLFSSMVYQGLLYAHGIPPSLQDIALIMSGSKSFWLRVVMAFLAVVIAPIFEECLFRGILMPVLIRRLGLGAGIFSTSLLFASIHAHLPSLAPLTVVAAGFSLAYLYSRSLWVPIIMHSLFNGVNLMLLFTIH